MPEIPTLYDWAGGQAVFEKLTRTFYDRVATDALIGPVFANMSPEHSQHVAYFIVEVFGGPKLYSEMSEGSHANMVAHHLGKRLTEAQRKRWVQLLVDSADSIGLADDPEFRSALMGYLEWGSRLAVLNSNGTENPIDSHEPMPRWGWGETKGPFQPKS